ncbi:MAG TPA: ABC transporter permease [Pyrinomonadaceae bacterium]|nr:ABC transporter permease [Pyrinomonadaceae bacterium]
MRTLVQDLRFGLRVLLKSPGFTAAAVVAVALGVAANTAIFSVVNAVLIQPLPYKEPSRLVMVWEMRKDREQRQNVLNPGNFLDWKEQADAFEDIAAFFDRRINLTGEGGEPQEVSIQYATPNLFRVLGVEPIKGRTLADEDAKPDSPAVVVISHGLWQRRFGGDPAIVGKTINLNATPATVAGVMPAGFQWFIRNRSLTAQPPELWSVYAFASTAQAQRRGRFMSAVARLKPGVTLEAAQTQVAQIAARYEAQYPQSNTNWSAEVVPLRDQLAGVLKPALWVLIGAVGFLLLIACANVANLLLARGAARQKELAIRTALGAGRWRVVRQLLTESVLLAGMGGALGLLLAWWGVDVLAALSPRDVLDLGAVRLNVPVLLFTLGVTLVTGVVFGVVPSLEASRVAPGESLKEGARGTTGGKRGTRLRGAFVVVEIALALVLLVGAGLMVRSFERLRSVDPGFRPEGVLTMRVNLPGVRYGEDAKVIGFFREAVGRVSSLPGVESAAAVNFLPFSGPAAATSFTIVGQPAPPPGQKPGTEVRVSDAGYFRTMGIPLRSGRSYSEQEVAEKRNVVVVSESFARKHFPGGEAIGQRVVVEMSQTPQPAEIVGVVGDVKHYGLEGEDKPTVYMPQADLVYPFMNLVVRAKGDPLSLAAAARREIQAIDAEQPVADVRTMEDWLADSVGRARFSAWLLGGFSLVALLLAAVGIYGVMSYAVAQRTHEIGVRIALGAQASDILKMVFSHGLALAGLGLAAGLVGAFALTRLMSSLLYQVSATDPLTYAAISAFLLFIALLACYVPARRAMKVDPMTALRYE